MINPDKVIKLLLCAALFFILALIVLPFILMLVNPMRRPEAMAKNYVLRLTPLGMDIEEVVGIVENHRNWRITQVSYEWGFPHPRPHTLIPIPEEWPYVVGDMSIRVDMDRFWPTNVPIVGFLMETIVTIFWGFDANGVLTDVYVWSSSR